MGKSWGRFMEARTEGKTPCPEYTKAMMPNTSGRVAQFPNDVAAPAVYPPGSATRDYKGSVLRV